MDHSLTTTAFTLDGYQIVKNLGVVRGIVVRSRSVFGTLGGSLQTLLGGNITLFTSLCEKTRSDAFEMMVEHAENLGANAMSVRPKPQDSLTPPTPVRSYAATQALLQLLLDFGIGILRKKAKEQQSVYHAVAHSRAEVAVGSSTVAKIVS